MKHTISVLVENQFGVLSRVTEMFSGRGFNIDTLNVGPTHDAQYSRITVTLNDDDKQLEQCIKQLNRFVNVLEVNDLQQGKFVARELILVKVTADSESRAEIMQICDIFRAKIIDVAQTSVVVEVTGDKGKIAAILDLLKPFGVIDLARTGAVALTRNVSGPTQSEMPDSNDE